MKAFLIGLCCLCLMGSLPAQQLISTAGAVRTGSQVHLSYSLGEAVTATLGGSVILTQGFQQTYNPATGLDAPLLEGVHCFPNPVANRLTISLPQAGTYHLSLYDARGRLVMDRQGALAVETELYLGHLAQGLYSLRLEQVATGAVSLHKVLKRQP